jgi:hypothetical protein
VATAFTGDLMPLFRTAPDSRQSHLAPCGCLPILNQRGCRISGAAARILRRADLRYRGQGYAVAVDLADGVKDADTIADAFRASSESYMTTLT